MCNKFILSVALCDKKLLSLLDYCNHAAEIGQEIDVNNLENISPSNTSLALMVANRHIRPTAMQWGFGSGSSLVINARCETIQERPMFKALANHQRCILPATGYFEWRSGDNLRHLITHSNQQPFYLAGLYRSDEKGRFHFVVLTRSAYGQHAKIHSRMPCILYSRNEAAQWLTGQLPVEHFSTQTSEPLSIEVQGIDQLRMEFDD